MSRRHKIANTVTTLVAVAVFVCAIVIMALRLGVVDGYDFGAGAYYYADIPDYDRIVNEAAYQTSVPTWIHMVLFIAWGWLMYRFWVWISRR